MSRRNFIQSHGADCRNWQWSWAFINKQNRFVIFGAWDDEKFGESQVILRDQWEYSRKTGHRNPAYSECLEYLGLVQDDGFGLFIFEMRRGVADPDDPLSNARIEGFSEELKQRQLLRAGDAWLAVGEEFEQKLADEISSTSFQLYPEGAVQKIVVNAVERSSAARAACISEFGVNCQICGFNFERTYGAIGQNFIHVHHLNPVSLKQGEYEINPKTDLIPVCPNCHAMLHKRAEPFSPRELRSLISDATAQSKLAVTK